MIELDIAHAETVGARAEQQDAADSAPLGTGDGASLLVLADGLGGHADGALASRIVIETFDQAVKGGVFDEAGLRRQALDGIIRDANRRIHDATDPNDGHRSMASTAVAAILANGTVRWISVGDSHLYVCRNGRLSKLNADHSQAGMMIRHGYSPNDEAVINARSVLVSALTGRDIEAIDNPAHDVALEIGDVVLLASDGLNTLSDTEIALAIDQTYDKGSQAIATELVRRVLDRAYPRQDNTTVIVARVLGRIARPAEPDSPSLPLIEATIRTDVPTMPVPAVPEEAPVAMAPAEVMSAPSEPSPMEPAPMRDASAMAMDDEASRAAMTVPAAAPIVIPPAPAAAPAAKQRPSRPMAAQDSMAARDMLAARRLQRNILIRIFLTVLVAAAIASVIVTQTG